MKFTLYTADCTGNAKNTNYPHQKVITSEADLKKAVAFDHVCALYDNFSRSDTNFQLSDVVPMDCDNDHSDDTDEWITPEKLSEMLTDVAHTVVIICWRKARYPPALVSMYFSRQRHARMQHFTKQSKPVSTRNFPSLTAMRWMPPVFCLARKVR